MVEQPRAGHHLAAERVGHRLQRGRLGPRRDPGEREREAEAVGEAVLALRLARALDLLAAGGEVVLEEAVAGQIADVRQHVLLVDALDAREVVIRVVDHPRDPHQGLAPVEQDHGRIAPRTRGRAGVPGRHPRAAACASSARARAAAAGSLAS
jgi:hypothetical protein